jgi:hypothetical protein
MTSAPAPDAFEDEEGTVFTVQVPDGANVRAVLHTVDPPEPWTEAGAGTTNLYFSLSAERTLDEGAYQVEHPRLDRFEARFVRVQAGGEDPDIPGYRAVVHRN